MSLAHAAEPGKLDLRSGLGEAIEPRLPPRLGNPPDDVRRLATSLTAAVLASAVGVPT